MFKYSIVLIFPIVLRDRHQILLVMLSKFERIANFYSPQNYQKTLFSNDFMENRS